ncbi:MAG TPA: 2-dehydropantoate 2-reductase N-terminal domain-containing protein [Acidimicrobiales bacterium]|nr:2-dehydropantoate 2-reductase N-terminal domain-containing protein [Acidimicrobiales bacterium]
MRIIVYGAGAIGGLAGALMAEAGEDVLLIARGAHAGAIARDGLVIESAEGSRAVAIPVATEPAGAGIEPGDAVLLATKSQDTAAALDALRRAAPSGVAVACLQNGVDNERAALRLFPRVYGVCVMCPATHLEPGVVQQNSVPIPGMLDVGRYPAGRDATAGEMSRAFRRGGFESIERDDVMRWKYRKLILNLGNAAQALVGAGEAADVAKRAQEEGEQVLAAAGVDHASAVEDRERRADFLQIREIPGRPYLGGSSWQSLQRGAGSIESDFLNGEIGLLGRLHGVPTPVNDALQQLAFETAARKMPPGVMSRADFEARLG